MNGFRRENSEIVVILEKTRKTWWKHVIIGHPEIDPTKVSTYELSYRVIFYDEFPLYLNDLQHFIN